MALILLFDKAQYAEGVITKYTGDRWALDMRVVDRQGAVDTPHDLGSGSASAYFPTAGSETPTAVACTVVSAAEGHIRATVLEATTVLLDPTEGMYGFVELQGMSTPAGLNTVKTPGPDLVIRAPLAFQET